MRCAVRGSDAAINNKVTRQITLTSLSHRRCRWRLGMSPALIDSVAAGHKPTGMQPERAIKRSRPWWITSVSEARWIWPRLWVIAASCKMLSEDRYPLLEGGRPVR
jgi:hypothetical protein